MKPPAAGLIATMPSCPADELCYLVDVITAVAAGVDSGTMHVDHAAQLLADVATELSEIGIALPSRIPVLFPSPGGVQ